MLVFTVSDIQDLCLHAYFCVRASSEVTHTIFVSPVFLNLIYYVFTAMLFIKRFSNLVNAEKLS